MKTATMTSARLTELTSRFSSARIAVLGDFFLDKYFDIDTDLEEISVETGKPAHQVTRIRHAAGVAGTIVNNLASLGCSKLTVIGYCGDDGDGYELRRDLDLIGCDTRHLHKFDERKTPVYLKPRSLNDPTLDAEHARFDIKNRTPASSKIEDALIASIDASLKEVQAVVIIDQIELADCGAVTSRVRNAIADRAIAYPDTVFWADSRRFIRAFRNVITKSNPFELLGIDNPPPGSLIDDQELIRSAQNLRELNRTPLVVTRGANGIWVSDPEWTEIPGVPIDGPVDPTGAGDSASAGATIALCSGASLPEAAVVANLVASITVQQIGVTGTAHSSQLEAARLKWESAITRR